MSLRNLFEWKQSETRAGDKIVSGHRETKHVTQLVTRTIGNRLQQCAGTCACAVLFTRCQPNLNVNRHGKVAMLIELYEQETVLWNIRNSSHKHSNTRTDALKRIADVIGKPIEEVEKKLHCIRSQYRREKTKIEKSKKSGAGVNDI
ncbi:hypothetical protein J6590_085843 [Homalodisca vitripennis]|nr:hypothetical protein J6590_085843 [Homalodisca vitripennis]